MAGFMNQELAIQHVERTLSCSNAQANSLVDLAVEALRQHGCTEADMDAGLPYWRKVANNAIAYQRLCECCGAAPATVTYGEPDATAHLWMYYVCEPCHKHCSSDGEGRPVHMLPSWDGSPETFEVCRAKVERHP